MENLNEEEAERYDIDSFQKEKLDKAVEKLQKATQKLQEANQRRNEVEESVNNKFALVCHSLGIDFEENEVQYDSENGQLVVSE